LLVSVLDAVDQTEEFGRIAGNRLAADAVYERRRQAGMDWVRTTEESDLGDGPSAF